MIKEKFSFKLLKEDASARICKINTQRGEGSNGAVSEPDKIISLSIK